MGSESCNCLITSTTVASLPSGGLSHKPSEPPKLAVQPFSIVLIMDTINVLAISPKGRNRIGKGLVTAIIEQNHDDKVFAVFPRLNQCRWIKKQNDPDFRLIEE